MSFFNLPWTSAVLLALALPLSAQAPADWIRRLGDSDFATREQAYDKLLKMGSAARDVLELGIKSDDAEIRSRCAELLARVSTTEFDTRVKAFLDDPNAELPGWKRYRELAPQADRGRFAELYRTGGELFNAIARAPKDAPKALLAHAEELKTRFLLSPKSVTVADMTVLLLATHDPNVVLDVAGQRGVVTTLDMITHWKEVREKVQADEVVRTLLASMLGKINDPALQSEGLLLLTRLEVREGLPLARRCLADRTLTPGVRGAAVMLVGRIGGKGDNVILKECLTDTSVIGTKQLRTATLGVQVRDVALAMLAHLHGEDPSDYGFPYLRAIPGPTTSYSMTCFGFANANDRMAAIERWMKRHEK